MYYHFELDFTERNYWEKSLLPGGNREKRLALHNLINSLDLNSIQIRSKSNLNHGNLLEMKSVC